MKRELLNLHNYILFGPDCANILGLARSLGEAGICNIFAIILAYPKPLQITHCKYVKQCIVVESIQKGLELIIEKFGSNKCFKKSFIFSSCDEIQSIIDKNYDILNNDFYFGNCGVSNGLRDWFLKEKQNELALEFGLNVPQSEIVAIGEMPRKIKYPIITKAIDSLTLGWKKNVFICHSDNELREAYLSISENTILLQEYVDRVYETKFQTLIYNGKILKNIPQCVDKEFSQQSYGNHHIYTDLQNPELLQCVEKMLNHIGYQGLLEVEFMKGKNGKLYFLEINFRNSGVGYFTTYCGANLPLIYAQSVLNENLCLDSVKLKKMPIQTIKDFNDFMQKVRIEGMNPIKWYFSRFHTAEVYLLWNTNDKMPAYAVFRQYAGNAIKKIQHKIIKKLFSF